MTDNKTPKKAARQWAEDTGKTGRSYNRARHEEAASRAALEPVTAPAPIITSLARQIYAAWGHCSSAGHVLKDYHLVPMDGNGFRAEPTGPIQTTLNSAMDQLWKLREWAEASAHASGVIPTTGIGFGREGTPEALAEDTLYPGTRTGDTWCREPGGTMPKVGETRSGKWDPAAVDARVDAQTNLSGPVPAHQFSPGSHSGRLHDVPAFPAVSGTPAEPVWKAYLEVSRYVCQHWERPADSPADLAAALDGLSCLLRDVHDAVYGTLGEIQRRIAGGTLDGVDAEKYNAIVQPLLAPRPFSTILDDDELTEQQRQELKQWQENRARFDALLGTVSRARGVMSGAAAKMPSGAPPAGLPRIAKAMNGSSLARVRRELADERHLNKQISKTRGPSYSREDCLERIARFMHAAGALTYSAGAHLDAEGLLDATS